MTDRLSQASFGTAAVSGRPRRRVPSLRRPRRGLSQRLRRRLIAAAFLSVTSLIAAVLLLLSPPHPAALILVGADYDDNLALPDNALGWNGLNELARVARPKESGRFLHNWRAPAITRLQDEKRTPLKKADQWWDPKWDQVREKTVVLYIDLHGAVDHDGPDDDRAYFFADDPGLGQRLRLKQVLDTLKGPQLAGKYKLLILDATKVGPYEAVGLHNDFVEELKRLDGHGAFGDVDKDRLAVLCSSGVNQRSWVSEEYRKPVFAQKVIDGLRGKAAPPDSPRVTALDLYNYVAPEVRDWAWQNRRALQSPVLFPEGDKGTQLAGRMELVRLTEQERADNQAEPTYRAFEAPPWLLDAWKEYWTLLDANPAPYVYAPHLWSEYQAVLLRREALARAGEDLDHVKEALPRLEQRRNHLKDDIVKARDLSLTSLNNSLAVARVFDPSGREPTPDEERLFSDLWDACQRPAADKERVRARERVRDWIDRSSRGGSPAALATFHGWLVGKVIDADPARVPDQLRIAHEADALVSQKKNDRPAEGLFLAMLDAKLPATVRQDGKRIQSFLELRRRAERVALGVTGRPDDPGGRAGLSEQIAPFIRDVVARADESRRVAEDYLFAGSGADLTQAEVHFKSADRDYKLAGDLGDAVRRALGASAEAHANLPLYGRWLARSSTAGEALLHKAEELWLAVHRLDEQLRPGAPAGAADRAGALRAGADGVRRLLADLKGAFDKECQELDVRAGQRTHDVWRRLEDVLAVPLIPAERRGRLVQGSRNITLGFMTEQHGKGGDAPPGEAERALADDEAREAARRHGRLALAALGRERLKGGRLGFDEARRYLDSKGRWSEDFALVGLQVAGATGTAAREVAGWSAEHLPGDPAKAREDLARIESRAREADGRLLASAGANPVEWRRHLLTADLCRWLAERTLLDRWWCEEGAKPYFQSAGGRYLDDARALLAKEGKDLGPVARAGVDAVDGLQRVLDQAPEFDLTLAGPHDVGKDGSRLHVFGTAQIPLDCRLTLSLRRPDGAKPAPGEATEVPAVWLDAPELGAAISRHGVPIAPGSSGPTPVRLTGTNPDPLRLVAPQRTPVTQGDRKSYKVTWHRLFRGREVPMTAEVVVYPAAEFVISQPPVPNVAGLGVTPAKDLADAFENRRGILVIVLDCSASMGWAWRKDNSAEKRIDAARKALREIMPQVPPGTVVSMITFAQEKSTGREPARYKVPIQVLQEPKSWGPGDADSLMKKVDSLVPVYASPIARAVYESLDVFRKAEKVASDLDGGPFQGKKTLLILTDGDDNCFEAGSQFGPDPDLQDRTKTKTIPDMLSKEFADSGVSLNMVVFRPNDPEKDTARKQFKEVIQEKLQPHGRYYDEEIDDTGALAKVLLDGMRLQLKYRLRGLDERSGVKRELPPLKGTMLDLDMLRTGHWNYYFYPPSSYELRTTLGRSLGERPVHLDAGELLLLQLSPDGFRRALVSDLDEFRGRPRASKRGWRLTPLRYAERATFSRSLLLAVEREVDKSERPERGDELSQVRPREVWLEAGPAAEGGTPTGVRWAPLLGSAAPVWEMYVPKNWGEVHAWVSRSDPGGREVFADGSGLAAPNQPRETTVQLLDQLVKGVRVSVEPYEVVDGQGKPRDGAACLVVRCPYDPAKSLVRAYLPSTNRALSGAEHHYQTAGKMGLYTGVFWTIGAGEEQMARKSAELRLISLKQFKESPDTTELILKEKDLSPINREPSLTEFNRLKDLQDLSRSPEEPAPARPKEDR